MNINPGTPEGCGQEPGTHFFTSLQAFFAALGTILRRADEHFDEVVVQGVVKLALEAPLELRVVQVARMQIEIVGVNREGRVFELDDDFDAFAFRAGGEVQ
jgi:hypothetical protein